MKLLDDNTALTHWEGEMGEEYEIKLSFIFNPEEKQTHWEPGIPAHVEVEFVERKELVGLDVYGWVEFEVTDEIFADYNVQIMEAINQEFIDNMGEE